MSLVNNMLRDLDSRRKDSNHSSGTVRLMPAREYVNSEKKNPLPYVVVGLIVVAIIMSYYWIQSSQSDTQQQLDIRVQPIASNTSSDSQRLIEELEESIVQAELAESVQLELTSRQLESQSLSVPINTSAETTLTESSAAELQAIPAVNIEVVEASSVSETSGDNSTEPVVDPLLVRSAPVESVKEAPEYSNEQLDTIAVQTALRQIANGQTDEADLTLEEYISANRFAHQSRETYAKLLMSRGRVADANALIDAGIQLAPNHAGFKKVKARILMSSGQLADAVDILISRAPSVAADPEYHDLLASAQLSSRDFSGAVISYRGLVQSDETQGKWWYGFAAAHDQLGNLEAARQAYVRAMQFGNLSANLRRRSQERLGFLSL